MSLRAAVPQMGMFAFLLLKNVNKIAVMNAVIKIITAITIKSFFKQEGQAMELL